MQLQQPPKWMQLDNDIGRFDNFLTPDECSQFIDAYTLAEQSGLTIRRSEDMSLAHHRQDRTMFMLDNTWSLSQSGPLVNVFLSRFWDCYREYMTHYSILQDSGPYAVLNMRLQKTLPTEGYHLWHYENSSRATIARVSAFMLYLNDVADGGETEFLYRSMRIKPKVGTLLIWPAGYTHTHRGNPPLTGDKYTITGWTDMA